MIDFLFSQKSLSYGNFLKNIDTVLATSNSGRNVTISLPPRYLEDGAIGVGGNSNINICSLSHFGALTYPEVAILEVAMAIENGADQIEIPIDMTAVKSGEYDLALGEIAMIVEEIDGAATISIEIESEEFDSFDNLALILRKLEDIGVYHVTLNRNPTKVEQIKYLKESLALSEAEDLEIYFKVNINLDLDNLDSELDKIYSSYNEPCFEVRVTF